MSFAASAEALPSRYVVGIDLGTTNSAICYVDTWEDDWRVQMCPIPQWVAPGQIESRDTLPSFHFQPVSVAGSPGFRLPWQTGNVNYVVGVMAREEGRLAPDRLIVSAKSWLCHHGVDRSAELLPWQGAQDVDRLSPIEVSARYLRHLREMWDVRFPEAPLAQQDLVLTLPASFDEIARELTIEAAAKAGLPRVILIEEPQAAFYAWVDLHRHDWHTAVSPGQKILVCDIGGGTSDFTLIRVRQSASDDGRDGLVQFHRIAVGEHLILGGDNLDLALARFLEPRLPQTEGLSPRQWDILVRTCRQSKEVLLGDDAPTHIQVSVPGTGSRLIGGSLQTELTRDDAETVLVEGFFPFTELNQPVQRHQSGFLEMGLPYAADPAVTRHLAAFLVAHRHADELPENWPQDVDPARPDLVLFNGGVLASPKIRSRLLNAIATWFRTPTEPDWQPQELTNARLDLAVAHGAAYYGMVRRGQGVRIAAGLARSYYLEVGSSNEAARQVVCVVPGQSQPGETIELPEVQFDLLISEPVEFPLFVSSTRLTDRAGQMLPLDLDAMRPLPALRTALRTQRRSQRGTVPVTLRAHLTEIGTIELWFSQQDQTHQWRLQFDVRSALETDRHAHATLGEEQGTLDESCWSAGLELLNATFLTGSAPPDMLMAHLQTALQLDRSDWPMTLLRRIWESLIGLGDGRRRSQTHEARWLNLLGYSLRPGYGLAVDDWRVAETWRLVQGKLVFPTTATRNESWVLWRRIAGGLTAGQQRALAEPLLAAVRALHRRIASGIVKGESHFAIPDFAEMWRLLGSLELLPQRDKSQLGNMLVELLPKRKLEPVRAPLIWTLGRLGNRLPLYGPLNTVIDATVVTSWVDCLLSQASRDGSTPFALMQMARLTGDRYRDLSTSVRHRVAEWLAEQPHTEHLAELVTRGGSLDIEEQQRALGDSLPKGLVLLSK